MTKHLGYLICAALISFGFAGCAIPPAATLPTPQNQTTHWNDRQTALMQIKTWDLSGKIAIRTAQESVTATMQWQQISHQDYIISLYGPLGTNAITLTGTPSHVTLATADGKIITAPTIQQLLAEQSGWNLPVAYLYYWIRGLPVPKIPHTNQYDNYHHLSELKQAGWQIEFIRYTTITHIDLPDKIFIIHPELNIKIIINQWHSPH